MHLSRNKPRLFNRLRRGEGSPSHTWHCPLSAIGKRLDPCGPHTPTP